MGQIKKRLTEMNELVEKNPDQEFIFAVAVDFNEKEDNLSGFLQVPKDRRKAKDVIEALAEMFFERPDYAMMFAEAYRMYFYKLLQND